MKSDVEDLSPTRVRLTVEVPFDELKPSLDQAYRKIASRSGPGFRPGKVPPRIIDQRFGRGAVLEQAINEAVPELYGEAARRARGRSPLGQPEVEITKLDDGEELEFTAEVDVRPKFDLPDLDGLAVTVDDAGSPRTRSRSTSAALRERFASLRRVERPVARRRLRLHRPGRLGRRRAGRGRPGQRAVLRGRQRQPCSTASTRR